MGLLRTHGLATEIGTADLRMDEHDAQGLLRAAGLEVSDADVSELVRRTEGWPAGLYLAALSAATSGVAPRDVAALTGNDPFVVDFLRSEFLAHLPPHELRFLSRTSMFERLSGPFCDAVLGRTGSAEMLESLAESNRFVVGLDRDREWYRCHPLVRELLAGELADLRPTSPHRCSAARLTGALRTVTPSPRSGTHSRARTSGGSRRSWSAASSPSFRVGGPRPSRAGSTGSTRTAGCAPILRWPSSARCSTR